MKTEKKEPTFAYTVDHTGCYHTGFNLERIEKIAQEGSNGPTDVTYLWPGPKELPKWDDVGQLFYDHIQELRRGVNQTIKQCQENGDDIKTMQKSLTQFEEKLITDLRTKMRAIGAEGFMQWPIF